MGIVYWIFKLLRIWSIFAVVSLLFSLLIMLTTYNIFKDNEKKPFTSFIPVYNLLIILDCVKMDRVYFILLLLPVVNIFTIFLILYRLSIVYRTGSAFAVGLIFLPIIFLPILNFSKFYSLEIEEKNVDVTNEMVTMLTQEQYNDLNNVEDDTPKVDNVFKKPVTIVEDVPVFKANKIKYRQMVLEDEEIKKIEKVEPVHVEELKENKFVNEKIVEEDDSIEIVEL